MIPASLAVGAVLIGLAKANVAAAVAVIVVLLLRGTARQLFGARAAYALWALPALAAAAALVPHPQFATPVAPLMMAAAAEADEFVAAAPAAAQAAGPDIATLLFAAWIAGAVLMAGLLLRRQIAFLASLGRLERISGRLFRAERMGVGPAVVGVLRPRIVAPADFETLYDPGERDLILAHETAHLRTGDAAVNALVCVAQCLGWFNPLAHVAAKLARIDQELACDAAVIAAHPGERKTYAELLLKTQLFTQPLPLGCHWPAGAEHPLKERIAMLKSPLPAPARRALGLALAGAVTLAGAAAAWAAQPGAALSGGASSAVGPAERAQAEREFRATPLEQRRLCKPRPDRTISNDCVIMKMSNFAALPTRADMMALYPAQARRDGVEAWIAIDCEVADSGKLGECGAIDVKAVGRDGRTLADPSAYGFDRAALAATRYIQAQPQPGGHRLWNLFLGFSENMTSALAIANPPVPREKLIAPPPPGAPVAKPVWVKTPTEADVARVYPAAAIKSHDRGYAALACKFSPNGRLRDCKVVSEAFGAGFGAAALKLADGFQARPVSGDGDQVGGGTVLIPIYFQPPARPVAVVVAAPAAPPRIAVSYAPDTAPPAPLVLRPDWAIKPTATDVADVYPPDAEKSGLGGMSTIGCGVSTVGRLVECKVVSEAPAQAGFGVAALKLAERFQMKPMSRDGQPVSGGYVRIPIRFMVPAPAPAQP